MTMDEDILVGQTITSVWINSDRDSLRFVVKGGPPITIGVRGACCTHSEIEDIDNPIALLSVIRDVKDPNYSYDSIQTKKDQRTEYYHCDITTDLGTCSVNFIGSFHIGSPCAGGATLRWPDATDIADDEKEREKYPENDRSENWHPVVQLHPIAQHHEYPW